MEVGAVHRSNCASSAVHQETSPIRLWEMDADGLEIWMIAGLLVDAHGSRAIAVAKARAERALFENDTAEIAVWRAVITAAETYLRTVETATH
jgi:hypothetical protein